MRDFLDKKPPEEYDFTEYTPLSVSFRDPIRPMHALKTGNGETTLLIM